MKRTMNKYIMVLAAASLVLGSCTKQLEIEPRQSIDASTALTSKEGVDASITAVYARLKSARLYGRDLISHPEALADNGHATNASGRLLPESNNVFNAHFTGTIWTAGFASINEINLALEAVAKGVPNATTADVARWEGQLFFLRGLYYFDMMRVYAYIPGAVVAAQDRGGVPLTTKGISDAATALAFKPSRAPIDEVYTQIIKDLEAAESRLLANTSTAAANVAVASKPAAQALLARVNLYRKNFPDAKKWADAAIASRGNTLTTTTNYVAQWRVENHQENIFAIRYATNAENIGVNESLQTSFTTIVTLPGSGSVLGGFGDLVPNLSLLNELGITLTGGNTNANFTGARGVVATRNNDVRNLLYEGGSNGRTKGWVECTKYLGKNGFINLDNVPVMRISEMYLLRAEIQATIGSSVYNKTAALADLQTIKRNRIVGYVGSAEEAADNALDGQALVDEILRQRRLEFAFEGHRFFDLKRLGRDIVKGAPNANPPLAFTDGRILPPIPQADVDGNTNLKQNFGY
jgi:hypothetical protein